MDECSSVQRYISANKKACANGCGDDFTRGYDSDRKKFCVCAEKKFYDAGKDACVSEDACEGYTYALDGDFRQCISEALCFERGNYAVDKDGKRSCEASCPAQTFADVSDTFRRCVGSCGERFVDGGLTCVDTCPGNMFSK